MHSNREAFLYALKLGDASKNPILTVFNVTPVPIRQEPLLQTNMKMIFIDVPHLGHLLRLSGGVLGLGLGAGGQF